MAGTTPIERLLEQEVDWEEIDLTGARFTDEPDALYATHKGVLEIGAAKLRVYQLNDGQRVTPPSIPDGNDA